MIIAVESEENVAEMFQVLRNAAIEGGEEFHRNQENVAEMFQVLRNAAIEGGEEFHRNQENVDHHGISNDDAKLVNGLAAGVEAGHFAQNQAKENQKRG